MYFSRHQLQLDATMRPQILGLRPLTAPSASISEQALMAVPGRIGPALQDASRWLSSGHAIALLSLLIYAGSIFALPQVQQARYCCEQSSVAAAISNVKYGTRLGTVYAEVFNYLVIQMDKPLERALADAQTPGTGLPARPSGELFQTTRDGNGVGYPLVATVAFGLFGIHAWALIVLMLLLMAFSAASFLLRFPGPVFSGVVTLYFVALTVMLFTPLVWEPSYGINISVGGIRYFSLVAVLPSFHILLELLNWYPPQGSIAKRKGLLLGIQTALLVIAILVRGSALSLIGAICVVALTVAGRSWKVLARRKVLLENARTMGLVSIGSIALVALLVPPNYLTEGRFGTVIWQRVTESLGINPAWPFPGTNDMFDCKKYVPGGLEPGNSDNNGGCMWFDYIKKHNIPIETIQDKTFGKLYETALREAFFKLAARYPREVLETFLYYKPLMILDSIRRSLVINLHGDQTKALYPAGSRVLPYPPLAVTLLLVSLSLVPVFFGVEHVPIQDQWRIGSLTGLLALFTLPSYLAAWAMPHTSADLLLYSLMGAGLACGAGVVFIKSRLLRHAAILSGGMGHAAQIGRFPRVFTDGRGFGAWRGRGVHMMQAAGACVSKYQRVNRSNEPRGHVMTETDKPATASLSRASGGIGQFLLKTCIVGIVISACTIFVADTIITSLDKIATRSIGNLREQWAATPIGGHQFWTKIERELDHMADTASDLPPEKKQKLINDVRVIAARWRPLLDALQAEPAKPARPE